MENPKIFDLPKLRNRVRVFRDRAAAGKVLASMLEPYRGGPAVVTGIPAGGMAVAVEIARALALPLDLAVVSKITLPWNTESGYGAVAFDGTVLLNEGLLSRLNLSEEEIQKGINNTKQKVFRRVNLFRGNQPSPDFSRPVILVDDGLASGITLRTAIKALRRAQAKEVILAIPTAHLESIQTIQEEVEAIYCPNIRSGYSFAVADAYERWNDLDEQEVLGLLQEFKNPE